MFNRAEMTQRMLARGGPLCGIYVITHRASGRRYVGQSVDIRKRWREHLAGAGGLRVCRAINKYGAEAFDFEIVELCDPAQLDEREMYYISAWGFDSAGHGGYNLTHGGDGGRLTPESLARLSRSMRESSECKAVRQRLAHDPEWRAKVAAANRRKARDPVLRAKQAAGIRRCCLSPEFLAKRAEAIRRSKCTDQTVYTLVHGATGVVERGKRYELYKRLGIDAQSFCDLVHGRLKTTKGWRLSGSQPAHRSQPKK